jgi:hypothetical protein
MRKGIDLERAYLENGIEPSFGASRHTPTVDHDPSDLTPDRYCRSIPDMKKSTIDQEIHARIHAFVEELSTLLRGSALEAVYGALSGQSSAGAAKSGGRRRGRPPGKAAGKAERSGGKRARRASSEVEALAARVHAYVKSHAGERLEEISKGLGIASQHLKLPIAKLLAARAVKTTGQKRGTKYHPSSGRLKAGGRKRPGRGKRK